MKLFACYILESGPTATLYVLLSARHCPSRALTLFFFGPPTRTCELLKIVHVFFLSGQRQNKPKFAPAFTFAMKEKANKQLAKCTRTVCPLNCMY